MRTAIVGGGIGGLITALLLSKRGFSVDIFEKENKLGGRLAVVEKDGYKIHKRGNIGRVENIIVLPNGKLQAGADHRGDDTAMGY